MLHLFSKRKRLYPHSDHCDGEKFSNTHVKERYPLSRFIKWRIIRKPHKWPKWVQNRHPYQPPNLKENEVAISFIYHASFLIQTMNLNILIDPIYSKRASPVSFLGPKRIRLPGVPYSTLPPIHLVLLSHNHYDHLDIPTLNLLKKTHNPLFITGLGNKKFLKSEGLLKTLELDWWEKHKDSEINITSVPAQHFSSRTPFDRNHTLWSGFVIEIQNKKIYHAGDTGYSPHFKEIYKKLGAPDVSLLPIGCYQPRWFMKMMHTNPEEAVQAHMDLHSKLSIPMHYGTFPLSDEPLHQPLNDLEIAIKKHRISNVKVLEIGETIIIP
ncbi:MAG: hydrolase [Verrucomicrobia bacterium]|nr:MAG: hydrolase [Verrucomicrobiota bacterium]